MLDITWQSTWPEDEKQDFTAYFNGKAIGRVYPVETEMHRGNWFWFRMWLAEGSSSGIAGSRRAAMVEIEEAFEKWWADPANRTRHPFN